MEFTLRQLEIFQAVALNEHITRAGEILHLSQSAVSMAISELESVMGGPLFERRGRRLLLNERGRLLLPEAKEILRLSSNVLKEMKDSADRPIGILKVGASSTIGNYLLPKLIGRFAKLYPEVEILLQVGNTEQIELAVDHGELDLGLIEGPSHLISLDYIPWHEDELVVIVGPKHPWAKSRQASLEMLTTAPWIVREKGSGTREVFEKAISKTLKTYQVKFELGHTEAIKKAVEADLGIGCISRITLDRELSHQWLVEVKTPLNLKRTLAILIHKKKYRTKVLEAFLELL